MSSCSSPRTLHKEESNRCLEKRIHGSKASRCNPSMHVGHAQQSAALILATKIAGSPWVRRFNGIRRNVPTCTSARCHFPLLRNQHDRHAYLWRPFSAGEHLHVCGLLVVGPASEDAETSPPGLRTSSPTTRGPRAPLPHFRHESSSRRLLIVWPRATLGIVSGDTIQGARQPAFRQTVSKCCCAIGFAKWA